MLYTLLEVVPVCATLPVIQTPGGGKESLEGTGRQVETETKGSEKQGKGRGRSEEVVRK